MSDSLYQSGFKPSGIRKDWDRTSISLSGDGQAGWVMRRKGVSADWGDPIDAVVWWRADGNLAVMVADYANGRRCEFRQLKRESRLSFTSARP